MHPLTREWIDKAEGDYRTAEREFAAEEAPNYDAVCFHAQQCAEKYLKARLTEAGTSFPKTHDLGALLALALSAEPSWATLQNGLDSLTDRAVEVRYPGTAADREDARESIEIARELRCAARRAFGL